MIASLFVLAMFFVVALLLAVATGAVACFLLKGLSFRQRLLASSFASALVFAPVLVGAGHGVAVLPLVFAIVHPAAEAFVATLVVSLPITWLFAALALFLVGKRVARGQVSARTVA